MSSGRDAGVLRGVRVISCPRPRLISARGLRGEALVVEVADLSNGAQGVEQLADLLERGAGEEPGELLGGGGRAGAGGEGGAKRLRLLGERWGPGGLGRFLRGGGFPRDGC